MGARDLPDRADADRGRRLLPAQLLAEHPRHPHRGAAERRAADLRHPPGAGGHPGGQLRHLRPRLRAAGAPSSPHRLRGVPPLREVRDPTLGPRAARTALLRSSPGSTSIRRATQPCSSTTRCASTGSTTTRSWCTPRRALLRDGGRRAPGWDGDTVVMVVNLDPGTSSVGLVELDLGDSASRPTAPLRDARPAHRRPVPVGRSPQLRDSRSRRSFRPTSSTPAAAPDDPTRPSGRGAGCPMSPRAVQTVAEPAESVRHWYKDAVIYELHVRAFRDSNGDGIGDFRGLIEKLDYLQDLGVTALWLLPFYPSPLRDDGYDISDYRQVHPAYGTLARLPRASSARRTGAGCGSSPSWSSTTPPTSTRGSSAPAGARPGRADRDFYVWSDTPERFADARIIFKDFETLQLDLGSRRPAPTTGTASTPTSPTSTTTTRRCARRCSTSSTSGSRWASTGCGSTPSPTSTRARGRPARTSPRPSTSSASCARTSTNASTDRMLLAEANQWPEDAVAYFGDGDECHMAFHFPLMPRMFMAARQEDRFPIVDILAETPATPADCQWALFLRNHDELTLEMVTDEERDYMYRVYAQDPQARVNVGHPPPAGPAARQRPQADRADERAAVLACRARPILYYGDEIGMGDNIYLGDRNGVRTPMQWNSDRNAGFSARQPAAALSCPSIIDPEYHSQAVNVEAQQENPNSLLWWMKRLIALRKRYRAFGRGTLGVLRPDNRKVLAFLRRYEDERILVVVNLSRFVQCVGARPLRVPRGHARSSCSGTRSSRRSATCPTSSRSAPTASTGSRSSPRPSSPTCRGAARSGRAATGTTSSPAPALRRFEASFPATWPNAAGSRRRPRQITSASVVDTVPVPSGRRAAPSSRGRIFAIVRVELDYGSPELLLLPLAFAVGARPRRSNDGGPRRSRRSAGRRRGRGALRRRLGTGFSQAMVEMLSRRRPLPGRRGRWSGVPTPRCRSVRERITVDTPRFPSPPSSPTPRSPSATRPS